MCNMIERVDLFKLPAVMIYLLYAFITYHNAHLRSPPYLASTLLPQGRYYIQEHPPYRSGRMNIQKKSKSLPGKACGYPLTSNVSTSWTSLVTDQAWRNAVTDTIWPQYALIGAQLRSIIHVPSKNSDFASFISLQIE